MDIKGKGREVTESESADANDDERLAAGVRMLLAEDVGTSQIRDAETSRTLQQHPSQEVKAATEMGSSDMSELPSDVFVAKTSSSAPPAPLVNPYDVSSLSPPLPTSSTQSFPVLTESPVDFANTSANSSAPSTSTSSLEDTPLSAGPTGIPMQRGDSTSSDSSASGLSRASSSSSVYATPFRMTPFRTPAGRGGGGTNAERSNSYFPLSPPRFAQRGSTYASTRSSFTGQLPVGGATIRQAAPVVILPVSARTSETGPSGLQAIASSLPLPRSVPGSAYTTRDNSPASSTGSGKDRIGPAGSAPFMANVNISPSSVHTIHPSPAAAYAAEATAAANNHKTPRPLNISLPPINSNFAGQGGLPSPGLLTPGGYLRAPIRPGLGGRTASSTSLSAGVNIHKRAQDFDFGETLGEGSYSTVFLATDKFPPHRQYALKVLDKKHIIKERKVKYVNVEKDTLARLDKHPGIIRLYWTFHDERSLYFVLELASNGEILKYIKEYGSFEVPVARFYAAQLLSALDHMHKKGVVHRDIKPENILLDSGYRIKVADFGTAKLLPVSGEPVLPSDDVQSRANSFVGTAQYVSPELLTGKSSTSPTVPSEAAPAPPYCADLWAFGCVLFQFICGHTPFRAPNEYLIFQKITKLDYDFPPDFPEDAKDLVRKLLVLNPAERLGATRGVAEVMEHAFFDGVDWESIWTCDVPAFRTGMTQPIIIDNKHLLQLIESEHSSFSQDDSSEADACHDESADNADSESVDPLRRRTTSSALGRRDSNEYFPRAARSSNDGGILMQDDMLPPPPSPARSSRYNGGDVPWPTSSNGGASAANGSIAASTGRGSNASMKSNVSSQMERLVEGAGNGDSSGQGHERNRSSGRWSKFVNTFARVRPNKSGSQSSGSSSANGQGPLGFRRLSKSVSQNSALAQ